MKRINTYNGWRKAGYQVLRGEKAHSVKNCESRFTLSQVLPIEEAKASKETRWATQKAHKKHLDEVMEEASAKARKKKHLAQAAHQKKKARGLGDYEWYTARDGSFRKRPVNHYSGGPNGY